MEVVFINAKLARMCNEASLRVRKLGPERALKVQLRLGQLAASTTLSDFCLLPQARCHQLSGDKDEKFSADLDGPYRLIFEIDNDPVPRLPDGGLDLTRATRVCVLEITDTH